ncbi:MAG: hypothetical protein V1816_13885 [Pseudomonadota bacterium]
MNYKEKLRSAMVAVFPSGAAFAHFSRSEDSAGTIRSFIACAFEKGLIETRDEEGFRELILRHAGGPVGTALPGHLTFEELFDKKDEFLSFNLSARALAGRINALLADHKIDLPKVSNSMLTRLKREPADTLHKQNVLRSMAFWLGFERAELGSHWNYETLSRLCRDARQSVHYREGVRIGFALSGRGDVIGQEVINWLKKDVNDYIEQSLDRYFSGRWGKVRSHDVTTLYVDFPKEEESGDPSSYRQCLRQAVALAHRLAIRWSLSRYYTRKRFLSIGIAAGDFSSLDNYLPPALNARLPGDPVIRLTDYARQCLLINDIRAILCDRPLETTLFNGETLNIWWVVGFWSIIYFDFVPDLLEDKLLQTGPSSREALGRSLPSPTGQVGAGGAGDEPNAVSTFLNYPHNSMLGLEIAKTLYYRRRFLEAIEILRIILSLEPTHLNARTLRMVLFRNLALEAPSYSTAASLFGQAEQEARYIKENCEFPGEDFFCEYAVVHLAKAMSALGYMRRGAVPGGVGDGARALRDLVFAALDRADELFGMGLMVSPSGIRSAYLWTGVRVLKAVLKNDEAIFFDPARPIDGPFEVVRRPALDMQWQLGYIRPELSPGERRELLEQIFTGSAAVHDASISLEAYRPTTYFCSAVSWWDFFPVRTVGLARRVIRILNHAAGLARSMEGADVCIYSFTRTYGEMIPPDEFIRHLERGIKMIEGVVGPRLGGRDDEVVPTAGDRSFLLMTLNF